MCEAFLFRLRIEGHYSKATWFQSIQEHENITNFLLDIEGDILESAEMEEGLQSQLFDARMLQDRNEKRVAVFWDELLEEIRGWVWVQMAINAV